MRERSPGRRAARPPAPRPCRRLPSPLPRVPMFKLDSAAAAALIAEEAALATLRSYPVETVLAAIDDLDEIDSEEDAFNALMAAMYALRPVGHL